MNFKIILKHYPDPLGLDHMKISTWLLLLIKKRETAKWPLYTCVGKLG